jgi:hypothetical protein
MSGKGNYGVLIISIFSSNLSFWSYFDINYSFPKREHILGGRHVITMHVSCYIRRNFSKPHHGGVVARHMSRLIFTNFAVIIKEQSKARNNKIYSGNTTQFNKWNSALLGVSISKFIQSIGTHVRSSCFSLRINAWRILNIWHDLPVNYSLEIETSNSVQRHSLNCVWLKHLLFYVSNVTAWDGSYNVDLKLIIA